MQYLKNLIYLMLLIGAVSGCREISVDQPFIFVSYDELPTSFKQNPYNSKELASQIEMHVINNNACLKVTDFDQLAFQDPFKNSYRLLHWYEIPSKNQQESESEKDLAMVFGYSVSEDTSISEKSRSDNQCNPELCDAKPCPGYKQVFTFSVTKNEPGWVIDEKSLNFSELYSSGRNGLHAITSGVVFNQAGQAVIEVETDEFVDFGLSQGRNTLRNLTRSSGESVYSKSLAYVKYRNYSLGSGVVQNGELLDSPDSLLEANCFLTLGQKGDPIPAVIGDFETALRFSSSKGALPVVHLKIEELISRDGLCYQQELEDSLSFSVEDGRYIGNSEFLTKVSDPEGLTGDL